VTNPNQEQLMKAIDDVKEKIMPSFLSTRPIGKSIEFG